jgi:Carotenoid biosynthesis protein
LLAVPIIAASVMVQWDVVMDPPNATLGHAWVWHDGGGYFGVPLSNFVGWYLTVWLFFQAFALLAWRMGRTWLAADGLQSRDLLLMPVLIYFSVALSLILPYFDAPKDGVEIAGTYWNAHDLRETSVIVALCTMVFTALLAFLRWIAGSASRRTEHGRNSAPAARRKPVSTFAHPALDCSPDRTFGSAIAPRPLCSCLSSPRCARRKFPSPCANI